MADLALLPLVIFQAHSCPRSCKIYRLTLSDALTVTSQNAWSGPSCAGRGQVEPSTPSSAQKPPLRGAGPAHQEPAQGGCAGPLEPARAADAICLLHHSQPWPAGRTPYLLAVRPGELAGEPQAQDQSRPRVRPRPPPSALVEVLGKEA